MQHIKHVPSARHVMCSDNRGMARMPAGSGNSRRPQAIFLACIVLRERIKSSGRSAVLANSDKPGSGRA